MNSFLHIFPPDFLFANAVGASLLMGALAPVFGRHLVMNRSILLGLALPQISLAGIAFIFWGAAMGWGCCLRANTEFSRTFIGGFLFTIPALVILAIQGARQKSLSEGWLAFLYLLALATTELFLASHRVGESRIESLLHGRLLLVSDAAFHALAATLAITTALALRFQRCIALALMDREFARATGLNITRWHVAQALLNGGVIGAGVATVGPMVTFGFLVLPVMASAQLARSLKGHLLISMILGAAMGLVGFWVAYRWDLPLGACVVATGCLELILARIVRIIPSS